MPINVTLSSEGTVSVSVGTPVSTDHRYVSNLPTTLSQFTASQNNLDLGIGGILRVSSTATVTITGFKASTSGDARLIINTGGYAMTLKHQSTHSTAANRIICVDAADYEVKSNGSAVVTYDGTDSRWRVG